MSDTELLKIIMEETHYTQSQIAKILNTSKQFISLVYRGKNGFSVRSRLILRNKFPQFFESASVPDELTPATFKQFRLDNNYTQQEFGAKLGIAQSKVAAYENGTVAMTYKFKDNFYRVFMEETNTKTIYYCPEVTIPNNFSLPENPEVIQVDKRLLSIEKGLIIDYSHTYLVTISGDTLKPEYENNDHVLLDTSHESFKDGYVYFLYIDGKPYVRRVNVSPNSLKCISLNKDYDSFYIDSGKCRIVGMIIPRIRL